MTSLGSGPPRYRAYIVGSDGHIKLAHDLACETDEQAVSLVQKYASRYAVELWDRDRKIAFFPSVAQVRDLSRFH